MIAHKATAREQLKFASRKNSLHLHCQRYEYSECADQSIFQGSYRAVPSGTRNNLNFLQWKGPERRSGNRTRYTISLQRWSLTTYLKPFANGGARTTRSQSKPSGLEVILEVHVVWSEATITYWVAKFGVLLVMWFSTHTSLTGGRWHMLWMCLSIITMHVFLNHANLFISLWNADSMLAFIWPFT